MIPFAYKRASASVSMIRSFPRKRESRAKELDPTFVGVSGTGVLMNSGGGQLSSYLAAAAIDRFPGCAQNHLYTNKRPAPDPSDCSRRPTHHTLMPIWHLEAEPREL